MSDFYRNIIDSLWPNGPIWDVKDDDGLDFLLDGMAENNQDTKDFLSNLSCLRCPDRTIILNDLEKEFGVSRRPLLSDETRRERLSNVKTDKNGNGTDTFLQKRLNESGFDVFVYRNSPAVDPDLILGGQLSVCGNPSAVCGNPEVICGTVGGELIVNGDLFRQAPSYDVVCGDPAVVCGSAEAICGGFDGSIQIPIEYTVPDDPGYWPLIFFVGGEASYNGDGSISTIKPADIEIDRRTELNTLIVKYKPIFSWCALIVNYI